MNNKTLANAKKLKNDEFYTLLDDIQKELKNYTKHFENKIIYLNCDNPKFSNFWKYFEMNFEYLGLKKLIATYYNKKNNPTCWIISKNIDGNKLENFLIKGDGDFRSIECINFLKEADIIISNPPFSLFREYVSQIIKYNKKFLIIGNMNAISYKEIFKLIKNNSVWLGATQPKTHKVPYDTIFDDKKMIRTENGDILQKFGNHNWFTNLNFKKRYDDFPLNYLYDKESKLYKKYCNYNAINVDKIKQIPINYSELMGVPISFLLKWNPNQFDIIGLGRNPWVSTQPNKLGKQEDVWYKDENGKKVFPYMRIIIKKKEIN